MLGVMIYLLAEPRQVEQPFLSAETPSWLVQEPKITVLMVAAQQVHHQQKKPIAGANQDFTLA